ncbi:hypothetical protein Tco_1053412 [Tanacetum coccineum]
MEGGEAVLVFGGCHGDGDDVDGCGGSAVWWCGDDGVAMVEEGGVRGGRWPEIGRDLAENVGWRRKILEREKYVFSG